MERGEKLILLLNALDGNYHRIMAIERMPASLDSAFTRYIPNPFFERMAESKIKQHIYQKGGVRLFDFYLDQLKSTKDHQQFVSAIDEVFKLYDRLNELAESDDEEVERLNKRLRRETIPERIRRLLGLARNGDS